MFNTLSHAIAHRYSPRLMAALLLAVIGFFWLFNFSSFPLSNPQLVKLSGGEGLLDLKPFYSPHEAFAALGRYGTEGRALYRRYLAADFVFPWVYGFGFALLMTRTVRAVFGEKTPWLKLNLLPLAVAAFDYVENICILRMLSTYPEFSPSMGTLSGIATLGKTVLSAIGLLSLAIGGFVVLKGRLTRDAP